MIPKGIIRVALVLLTLVIIVSAASAFAANISMPNLRLSEQRSAITAEMLKPDVCSAILLTAIVTCPPGGGACDGTDASELILGSAAADDIVGGKGDDCIVGGDGDDHIKGDKDTDICIGGPGMDSFHPSCETENQ